MYVAPKGTIRKRRTVTAHAHKAKKNVGITVHGKPGAHQHHYAMAPGAKTDVWHHKAQG